MENAEKLKKQEINVRHTSHMSTPPTHTELFLNPSTKISADVSLADHFLKFYENRFS